MKKADLNNPSERKKLILAAILGVVAIVVLWWAFIGFGSNSTPKPARTAIVTPPPGPAARTANSDPRTQAPEDTGDLLAQLEPISYQPGASAAADPKRNIFVYYEKPVAPPQEVTTPTPTPTPTPPVILAALSPSNVYARTGDFTLEVSGDKFSRELRVVVDGQELVTKYQGPQMISAVVPAALIAAPGQRQVIVRSPDGRLYSNPSAFSIAAPPTPNYNYIGIIGTKHYVDIALIQDKGNPKEILNVQRGDVLGGRFRVTSISEREVVLTDTSLKIKHSLAMSSDGEKGLGPLARPTPKVEAEDDEP